MSIAIRYAAAWRCIAAQILAEQERVKQAAFGSHVPISADHLDNLTTSRFLLGKLESLSIYTAYLSLDTPNSSGHPNPEYIPLPQVGFSVRFKNSSGSS